MKLFLQKKLKNKGQVGETLTWIVATILIIIMMVFFIFGASLLGGTKKIGSYRPDLLSGSVSEASAPFLQKSLFTYVSIGSSTKKIMIDKALLKMANAGSFEVDYNKTKKETLLRYNNR